MAQKLGLALVALLGLANAQIAVVKGGVVTLLSPGPAAHGGLKHEDDCEEDDGPKLGHEVVLGHAVVLGEKADHDDHDEGHGFGILNFANAVGHDDDDQESHHKKKGDKPDKNDDHDDKPKKKGKGDSGKKKDNDQQDSSDKSESKPNKGKGEKPYGGKDHSDKEDKPTVNIQIVKTESKGKHDGHRQDDDHHEGDAEDVFVPVFGKLKYVDNDDSGEATKAPITVVTAPLVSTAKTDHHKVGVNQVVGKTNCPECKEDEHEAKKSLKSANKALSKNVDKLSTDIKGPIQNVVVDVEHTKVQEEEEDDENSDEEEEGYDRHGGAIIDQKRLKKQLAAGGANEKAPFVVGAVKFTSSKHLSTEDDDHHDGHKKKSSKRHD